MSASWEEARTELKSYLYVLYTRISIVAINILLLIIIGFQRYIASLSVKVVYAV